MNTVTLLLNVRGETMSVWALAEDAQRIADRYNADPMIDAATIDPDAPYSVSTFGILDGNGMAR